MARGCTFSMAHVSPGRQRYRSRLCVQVQIMHNGEELPAAAGNVTDVGFALVAGLFDRQKQSRPPSSPADLSCFREDLATGSEAGGPASGVHSFTP